MSHTHPDPEWELITLLAATPLQVVGEHDPLLDKSGAEVIADAESGRPHRALSINGRVASPLSDEDGEEDSGDDDSERAHLYSAQAHLSRSV
jgi:hypothetical protein